MKEDLLIGFDLGTSAAKAILIDANGTILARASRPTTYTQPQPGYNEYDSAEYFSRIVEIIRELTDSTAHPDWIRAISLSGASGNALILDSDYQPMTKTISWNDQRTRETAEQLWPELDRERIHRQAGWPWNGIMPLAQLAWLRDNNRSAWQDASYFAMNSDYLYYRLCGALAVDRSKATTFFLQEQTTGVWNPWLLDFLGIRESSLPTIVESGVALGTLDPSLCSPTGLSAGTLIVSGSFDHPSAARSTGVFDEGDILISAGTSWVAFAPVRDRNVGLEHGMLIDPFLSPDGCWGVMFSLTSVAEKIDILLRNRFGGREDVYEYFDATALESAPGADGLFLDPWKQTPNEVAAASRNFSDAAYSRALMEGCSFLLKNRIDRLRSAISADTNRIVMVGGPTKSPIWPEILAAVIGAPVYIPDSGPHAGALGAAMLAGIGSGLFADVRDGWRKVKSTESIKESDSTSIASYQKLYTNFGEVFQV